MLRKIEEGVTVDGDKYVKYSLEETPVDQDREAQTEEIYSKALAVLNSEIPICATLTFSEILERLQRSEVFKDSEIQISCLSTILARLVSEGRLKVVRVDGVLKFEFVKF